MQRPFTRTALLVLWCIGCATVGKAPVDARLVEAKGALEEGKRLQEAGKYKEAVPLAERALALREEVLGGSHPEVAICLHILGDLLRQLGDHKRAAPLLERALAIREAALGPDHPLVADSLNSQATLYDAQGQYARAELLHERALAIREATLGPIHPDVAQSLNNLGVLYCRHVQYARAAPLLERALAIREAALGPGHLAVASSLSGLATCYYIQGQYARAAPLFERALAIRETVLGPGHLDIAESLNDLANIYRNQGQYAQAKLLYKRALTILETVLGPSHYAVAYALYDLALLYHAQEQYKRAERLYERALALVEAVNPGHQSVAFLLISLATLRLGQRRLPAALSLLERSFATTEEHLRTQALSLSEERLASALQLLDLEEEHIYALLRAHSEDSRVRHLALAYALLRKGRSAEELADMSRTIYRSLGAEDRTTFEQLRALRTQLTSLSLAGPGRLTSTDYQRRLKELKEQGDELETSLARHSTPLRVLKTRPSPEQVVESATTILPKNSALIEFIAYQDKPFDRALVNLFPAAQSSGESRYLALILFSDGRTDAIDLGPAVPMDGAIQRLREAFAKKAVAWQPAAEELYRLAFRPLLPVLGKTRRLFMAPDGLLSLVPFDALHDGKRFLIDRFDFTYLTSGKDLLPRPEGITPSASVVVLAAPDFGARPAAPSRQNSPAARSPTLARFFSGLCKNAAALDWASLPGTRQEAEAIQHLLPQATLLLGGAATKSALLQVKAPGILHIATHGFFLDDAKAPEGTRGVVEVMGKPDPVTCPADPLLRSGLVLSGAQTPAEKGGPSRREDSLVTALELAGVDLWGTQLVVLSACDTGRGAVKPGQGVYGLRRALGVAGAETIVMSLWKVDDDTTRDLMAAYYRHLLAGKGRTEALHEAMKALRKAQPHPYYWASFLAVGQQTPLRRFSPPVAHR